MNLREPFIPDDFLRVTSGGGNIGRFYWCNQATFEVQSWNAPASMDTDPPTEVDRTTIPGDSAWIFTTGDWFAWIFS